MDAKRPKLEILKKLYSHSAQRTHPNAPNTHKNLAVVPLGGTRKQHNGSSAENNANRKNLFLFSGSNFGNVPKIAILDSSKSLLKGNPVISISMGNFSTFTKVTNIGGLLSALGKFQVIGITNGNTRYFTSSAPKNQLSCLPPPLAPKCVPQTCEIKRPDKEECKIKGIQVWKGCEKICMPCCCPTLSPPECVEYEVVENTSKKEEYRIPAYSECRKEKLEIICPKECCYFAPVCPLTGIGHGLEDLVRVKVRQERILGRTRLQGRTFSTMTPALLAQDKGDKDCKKLARGLPCLQPSELLATSKEKEGGDKKDCEKFCMPCCAPARDPPDCYYPYVKPECKKMKAPRPAYSECKKDALKTPKPCECLIPRMPPCNVKEDKDRGCFK